MAEWDKEMKEYLFDRKVKATDRTKTPEEIAKEEADRLHTLETRRLARMNGDFENDDFDDISGDEETHTKSKKKKRSKNSIATAEKLDDSDDDEHNVDQTKVRFTSEGLVHVDKNGKVVGKVENDDLADSEHSGGSDDDEADEDVETDEDNEESEEGNDESEDRKSVV